jgi:integrase
MRTTERRVSQLAAKRFHLTADEMFEVLDLARKTSARDWCVLVLALNHCCRVSELAGGAPATKNRPAEPPLRLIDVEANHITIRRLKGSLTTRQPLINHRGRPTLSDKPAIEAYLKERIDDGSGLFFTGQKGRLTRWTLDKMFRRYCQLVSAARVVRGGQPIPDEAQRFHALKHTGVTFVVQGSKDLLATKDWAGHASISSTMIYAHPDARQTAQYAQSALGNAFATVRS